MDLLRRERVHRAQILLGMELRRGAALVDASHLPGELLGVLRGIARDKQRGLVAVPGQSDVAGRRSPVLGVIEVGLIERFPLPPVNRTSVAVPKFLELGGVESERPGLAAVEL